MRVVGGAFLVLGRVILMLTGTGDFSRPIRTATKVAGTDTWQKTATKIASTALAVCALLLMAGAAWAFDPPRVIGELYGTPDSSGFGNQFCWVGDQNGDGFDDLLTTHRGIPKLYFGDNEIDNRPDILFYPQFPYVRYGGSIQYLGRLTANNENWFIISSSLALEQQIYIQLNLYKGGEELDTIPDIIMTYEIDSSFVVSKRSFNYHPSDFNGDGYTDILCAITGDVEDKPGYLSIYHGGAEFDTIPDWFVTYPPPRLTSNGFEWSSGFDINNDGCDDFILKNSRSIEFYLGGDPMDTVAFLQTNKYVFEPRVLGDFAMFPDVNGDGYDDWGFYWGETNGRFETDGYFLFYGSDEPDFEPDLELDGNSNLFGQVGFITGGDYNGDDFGDIVALNTAANSGEGEMHIYFGSPHLNHQPNINLNIVRTYGERYVGMATLGAIGDYDGNGSMDFIARRTPDGGRGRFYVLSAAQDWFVSVESETTIYTETWHLDASPNPFNNSLSINIFVPVKGDCMLSITDISGREIWQRSLSLNEVTELALTIQTDGLSTGIYWVRCSSNSTNHAIAKKVVLLR